MRSSFQLDQTISLVVGDSCFDLHNNFDFVGFEYHAAEKKARLVWRRGDGGWVPDDLPKNLILLFDGVTNLTVQRRDDEMPFTEDTCVASITFLPPEFGDNYAAICPDHRSDDEHLSIEFQSGAGIKIWAESVTHEI